MKENVGEEEEEGGCFLLLACPSHVAAHCVVLETEGYGKATLFIINRIDLSWTFCVQL